MEIISSAYRGILWVSAAFFALMICGCFIRTIIGPRFTDRIVSINVVCTKAVILIAVLSYLLEEKSLIDVAIVYAMINFLTMIVLYKCYPLFRREAHEEDEHEYD
ncbi:MAG: monovalent cation/H+ antiporter complex subunit F [Clostridiales bacterium]|nr:monovalent cation/H+ antiporter complex subunit F [Clostridiales bacterium]